MKKSILFSMLLGMSTLVFAQGGDPGPNPDVDVPLDGGVVALAAAGAIYGAKKLKELKHRKPESSSLKSE